MNSYRKNLAVGIVMLSGLALLGYMIVKFGDAPAKLFASDRTEFTFAGARADGLSQGSGVMYLGVDVGTIAAVERDPHDPTRVLIHAMLDKRPPLPGNLYGKIRSQLVGGGSSLDLELIARTPSGEQIPHPVPTGQLDPHQLIPAEFVGVDVLPPEFGELATELRQTAEALRKAHVIEETGDMVKEIRLDAQRAGKLMETLDRTVGDPKMQEDLRVSLANFRTTTDNAAKASANLEKFSLKLDHIGTRIDNLSDTAATTMTKTQANLDDLTKKVNDRLEQVARLLETFQSVAGKIDHGKGTAGMFINDSKLYQSLADTAEEIKLAVADLKLLIEQWTQEGVSLKLGGK